MNQTVRVNTRTRWGRSVFTAPPLNRTVIAIIVMWLGILILGIHIYVDLDRGYSDDTAKGKQLAESYVRLVAEHAIGTFDRVDLVLERAVKLTTPADQANIRALGNSRRGDLEIQLKALQARAEGIVSMSMTDETGYVFANTVEQPPGGYLGDRGYFLALKNGTSPEPVVSEVIFGRISNKWGIQIARKITRSDGSFGGMVVANVGMSSYLKNFYESLKLPSGSIFSLRDLNHKIIVRYPESQEFYGKIVIPTDTLLYFENGSDEVFYIRHSPLDSILRFVAIKKLRRYSLYAVVGIPEAEIHSAWQKSLRQAVGLFIFIFIFAFTLTMLATILSYRKYKADKQIASYAAELGQATVQLSGTTTALSTETAVRMRTEQTLREKELLFQVLVHEIPQGIVLINPDGSMGYLNPALTRMLGYTIEDIPNTASWWLKAYPDPDYRAMVMEAWRRDVIEAPGFDRIDRSFSVHHRDGSSRFIRFVVVPLPDARLMVTLDDITESRQAALKAERAMEAERQVMREQRNFVGMVSHEFRMPLAIIQGAGQLLDIYTKDHEEAQEEAAKIGRAVRRMTDLMDVFLADERLECGEILLDLTRVELGTTLNEVCQDRRSTTGDRFRLTMGDRPTTVRGDVTMLRIAFSNLIDNALKFSPLDQPVGVAITQDDDSVTIRVSDQGPGISLEDQAHIFEKFYRSTRTDHVRGVGLGLFIVKRIIEFHGGAIAVDSRPGAGTTVMAVLPLDR